MDRPPTTARMTRHLRKLGVTPTQHGKWCGLPLEEWIAANPTWTERDWYELVTDNLEAMKEI